MKNALVLQCILSFGVAYSNVSIAYRKCILKGNPANHISSQSFGFIGPKPSNTVYHIPSISNYGIQANKIKLHRFRIDGLNEEKAELHPDVLSNIESQIDEERLEELKKKGFIEGDSKTWRNWHILSQGQWEDIGSAVTPPPEEDLKITEPYALRKPLKYWGFLRGIETNISSYPKMWEFYNETYGKVDVHKHGGDNPLYNPLLFQPTWFMGRDRRGIGYCDVRFFEGWTGLDINTPTRVKPASDVISIPDAGRRYQKFYMGPYPITMGWTIGSLLKVITQSRCPGHAIVALKIHNMNKDTTIPGVAEDLLNIALNLKGVRILYKSIYF
ncbi:bifunctional DNA-directed RNA polymerase [Babesia duncani]|uniref:Bifunctional DNA-directed RNA polymerase n=1 Tax=Babesia duncani TaxID=323732 RepID=A0AAD9PM56_9APIC|nr:bifunctional DNA-directed RNA polymerase [Babesia duncani]